MIIDADVHLSPTPERGISIKVDELLRRMDRAGVEKASAPDTRRTAPRAALASMDISWKGGLHTFFPLKLTAPKSCPHWSNQAHIRDKTEVAKENWRDPDHGCISEAR